jgi:hypothetical protein
MQSNSINSSQQATFNEQKFLADRCRWIKLQIQQEAVASGQQRGSGYVHKTIFTIENYLSSVGTSIAFQMLGDLQNAGYNGFNKWCSKYGI